MTDVNVSKSTASRRMTSRMWVVVAVSIVALAAIGYAAWKHFERPVDARFETLVELIASDPTVVPAADVRGKVVLTGRFAGLTPHDEMYLARRADGTFIAMFPTFYGTGASIAGLAYTSRPLGPQDTYMRQVTASRVDRVIDVAAYTHMNIDGRIDDHWYRVSWGIK